MWYFLFNLAGLIGIYFLLRWRLRKNIGVEKQFDLIRTHFNELTVDMNDATSRNLDLLESRIKEAKKLIRQLEKAVSEYKDHISQPETTSSSSVEPSASSPVPSVGKNREESPLCAENVSDALRQSVLKLAVRGLRAPEIAEILNCQLQEVELVLAFTDNPNIRR